MTWYAAITSTQPSGIQILSNKCHTPIPQNSKTHSSKSEILGKGTRQYIPLMVKGWGQVVDLAASLILGMFVPLSFCPLLAGSVQVHSQPMLPRCLRSQHATSISTTNPKHNKNINEKHRMKPGTPPSSQMSDITSTHCCESAGHTTQHITQIYQDKIHLSVLAG